jgi:hypothetical protein
MKTPTPKRKGGITRADIERTIYLVLVVGLTVWGLWHSEAAVGLIGAVREAFSILLNITP